MMVELPSKVLKMTFIEISNNEKKQSNIKDFFTKNTWITNWINSIWYLYDWTIKWCKIPQTWNTCKSTYKIKKMSLFLVTHVIKKLNVCIIYKLIRLSSSGMLAKWTIGWLPKSSHLQGGDCIWLKLPGGGNFFFTKYVYFHNHFLKYFAFKLIFFIFLAI